MNNESSDSTGEKSLSTYLKPFTSIDNWLDTFRGPCASSSIGLGAITGSLMIIQKYRLNRKNYLNILNWALFTFTSVTCTSYYLCAKKHNESIAIGVRNKN